MDTTTVAQPAHPSPREKDTCSGCGTTTKTLTAPHSGARDYIGPMYCLGCNPRFGGSASVEAAFFTLSL